MSSIPSKSSRFETGSSKMYPMEDSSEFQSQAASALTESSYISAFPESAHREEVGIDSSGSTDTRKRKKSNLSDDNPLKKTRVSCSSDREDRAFLVRLLEGCLSPSNSNKLDFYNQNLSDDDIKEKVIPELSKYGEDLRSKSVDLRFNRITALGIALLVELEHLINLDVSNNEIGDEGAIILAQTRNIKKLDANVCNIGRRGAEAFLESSSIEEGLMLVGNPIRNSFIRDLGDGAGEKAFKGWQVSIDQRLNDNKARNNPQFAQELEAKRKKEITEKQIMDAIEKEDIALLKILIPDLEEGVNTRLDYGCNLLTYALDQKSTVCVEALLKMGARIEDHEREYTPLFTAAENGNLNMVQLLLTYGSNITGEFYFNNETALSIAAFKFCQIFQSFLKKAKRVVPKKEHLQKMENYWKDLQKAQDLHPIWQLFSEKDLQDYGKSCLEAFEVISERNPELIDEELSIRFNVFRLIEAKFQTIKEKAPSTDEDGYSTDEDINLTLAHKIEPVVKLADQFQDLTIEQLEEHINRLNQELKTGKTEETIDWSTYPRFFIAQFRGIHYYRHHFSKKQRADHRLTSHLNRIAPAPAAYFMSSLTPKEHQLARESAMKARAKEIGDTFEQLAESGKATQYWGRKKHEFENQSDMIQQRMSGSYGGYMREIAEPVEPATQLLFDRGIRKGYPHYATSDLPRDALRYTFGQKPIEGLTEWRLRPRFQMNGKVSHPYPGKIFVTMFTPFQMHLHRTRHVGGMHNRGKIQLPSTVAPERETSIPGGVDSEISVYEELGVIPSFVEYHPTYLEKYGISEEKFKKYKQDILLSLTAKDSSERDKIRKRVKNQVIDSIIKHKEYQLLQFALNEAKRLGGHLIFRHFDGEYGLNFEKMRTPQKSQGYSYSEREKAIIDVLDTERQKIYPSIETA